MKYFIKTFGCQMNTSDSERIASFLESKGFSLAKKINEADLAIFNTCGIKQTAENRAYSMINNLRKSQSEVEREKRKAIMMTGCLANRIDVQKRMKTKVDLFFEIKNIKELENFIIGNLFKIQNSKFKIQNKRNNLPDQEEISYLTIKPKHTNKYQTYVPIMTGCNNFCSYCVVPHARGREVSRPADEIISEVKELISKNYKHIVLLGQNVNSYKSKVHKTRKSIRPEEEINFEKLLKKINLIPGKFWISFVSSHPKDMTDNLIEAVTKCKKVCEWIHLPVQAGDDSVLARMNRKYTKKHYLGRIAKIKSALKKNKPGSLFSISSDIIVGFPGETKKQFLQSAEVMKESKFDMVFLGQFSPRPGTKAFQMKDNVSGAEKIWRENFLNDILKKTTLENNQKYINKKIEVLIEKEKDGFYFQEKSNETNKHIHFRANEENIYTYFGKTRTMKNVKIISNKKGLIGKFTKVLITKANTWNLEGHC